MSYLKHNLLAAIGSALWLLMGVVPAAAGNAEHGLWFHPAQEGGVAQPAPTLASRYDIKVEGPHARSHVQQFFFNPTDQWQEAVYRFPLPERAAIDRMQLRIGARVIEGVIDTKPKARETYEAARRDGKAAALYEATRANLFTISVANIPPRSAISVSIAFDTEVRREGAKYSLIMPLVAAPRYNHPIDMDAFFASPDPHAFVEQLIARGETAITIKPANTGKINPVWIDTVLVPGFDPQNIKSPSHDVKVSPVDEAYLVSLARTVPADADFKLEWEAPQAAAPRASLLIEQADAPHAWLQIMPPAAELWQPDDKPAPREIIFVLDRSGSMGGGPMDQAKQALLFALTTVSAQDRLNVIAFDDQMIALFDGPQPANALALQKARAFIEGIEANGGTEMWSPLNMALQGAAPDGFQRQVILATDALIGYETELLQNIEAAIGTARLFPIAIGAAPNHDLVQWVGDIGRGAILSIGDQERVADEMSEFLARIAQPALTDISVEWDGVPVDAAPAKLGDLFAGLPLTISAKLEARPAIVTVRGNIGSKQWSQTITLDQAQRVQAGGAVTRAYGRRKLSDAMRMHLLAGNDKARKSAEMQATDIALSYGLLSRFTSLVAVDQTPARPEGEGLTQSVLPANQQRDTSLDEVVVTAQKRSASMRAVPLSAPMAQGISFSVPQTATPSPLLLMLGAALLVMGLVLLALVRRRLQAVKARFE